MLYFNLTIIITPVLSDQFQQILGRGTKEEAYYCYDGQDYLTKEFSWIVSDKSTYLINNKDCSISPKNVIKVTSPLGGTENKLYLVIARTKDGMIPGMSDGTKAFYAYGGREKSTSEFDWIVVENKGR